VEALQSPRELVLEYGDCLGPGFNEPPTRDLDAALDGIGCGGGRLSVARDRGGAGVVGGSGAGVGDRAGAGDVAGSVGLPDFSARRSAGQTRPVGPSMHTCSWRSA
jgi:hypothetical protein